MNAVPLGELGDIVSGSTPKTHMADYWNGDIPWVTPADLSAQEGIYFHGSPKRITQKGLESCSAKILPPGSILFSSRAPIGHSAVTRMPLCTNQGFKSLVPNKRLHPVYGYFALKFITPLIVAQGRGATFAEVNKEIMEEVQIPYRDIAEQQRIAAQLEQADRLCRTRRYALELSDRFLPAAFLELFGDPVRNEKKWEAKTIDEIASKITDGEHLNPTFVQAGVPIVMAEQVEDFGVNLRSCKMVSPDDFTRFTKKCAPHLDDILVVSRGATIGRNCVVNVDAPFCMMASVILIKPNRDMIYPRFFAAQLKASSFQTALRKTSGSSAQQAIYISQLRENKVVVPPLPLQQKFAALVERHERLRATQREALRQADHLFQTLLHKAFAADQ